MKCQICQSENANYRLQPCCHYMHHKCVIDWRNISYSVANTCPVCITVSSKNEKLNKVIFRYDNIVIQKNIWI